MLQGLGIDSIFKNTTSILYYFLDIWYKNVYY